MYKLGTPNQEENVVCVKRLSDNAFIPFDPANTDYQAFTRWLNDGNIPLPADEGVNNGETTT
jgi:hypothetical protein